jgi:aspartate aminotransferase
VQEKNHMPFFDIAYQGFATGSLDQDAAAPRMFVGRGMEGLFAQSYSKNLGLYAERVGAFTYVGSDAETTKKVLSQCKRLARAIYSNPPVHGARIVAEVVGDEAVFNEWRAEMEGMAGRIRTVRKELHDHLCRINPDKNWDFIINQIGMFSFTGLTPAQVENMTNKHQVYMTKDGRISMAGLNSARAEYLAQAIDDSVRNF